MSQSSESHQSLMQKTKSAVDEKIAAASRRRGILIVITGHGKGKTTSAFGTALRAVGHGRKVGVVQFIKGKWKASEVEALRQLQNDMPVATMKTGFTWETQNKEQDTIAAKATWRQALSMLSDQSLRLVVLDELTYMLNYQYLDSDEVYAALQNRPATQTVIVTGREAPDALCKLADTVSVVQNQKHAFDAGIKAQKGIDY